jgi:hypothetical protein
MQKKLFEKHTKITENGGFELRRSFFCSDALGRKVYFTSPSTNKRSAFG